MTERSKAYLFVILSTVALGFNFIISKYALGYLKPLTFCLIFFSAASVYTLLYAILRKGPRILRISKGDAWSVIGMGVTNAVSILAFFTSISLLSPTVASLFNRIELVFTVMVGIAFMRERFNLIEGLGLGIVVAGILIMNWASPQSQLAGFVWMAVACLASALGSAAAKHCIDTVKAEAMSFHRAWMVLAFLGVYAVLTGDIKDLANAGVVGVRSTVACALFGPFVSIVFFYKALERLEMSKTVAIQQGVPFFVAVLSYIAFHKVVDLRQGIGGVVLVAGILLLIAGGRKTSEVCETAPSETVTEQAVGV